MKRRGRLMPPLAGASPRPDRPWRPSPMILAASCRCILHAARVIKRRRGRSKGKLKPTSCASCRTPWLAGGQLDPPVSSLQAFAQTAELPDGRLNLNWKLPRQPRQGCCPGRRGRALWASASCLGRSTLQHILPLRPARHSIRGGLRAPTAAPAGPPHGVGPG